MWGSIVVSFLGMLFALIATYQTLRMREQKVLLMHDKVKGFGVSRGGLRPKV